MTITEQLARVIAETTYEQLPGGAVTQAKRALLDTIGVTLAGHREAAGQIITAFVKDIGGHSEAAILGTSLYTSPALAALANGTLGHALDFDDVTFICVDIPACLWSQQSWRLRRPWVRVARTLSRRL